jgi:hypothetical protein
MEVVMRYIGSEGQRPTETEGEENYPDPPVSANPSFDEYLTDVKICEIFCFYFRKNWFSFVTNLKDVYTTMALYRSSDRS